MIGTSESASASERGPPGRPGVSWGLSYKSRRFLKRAKITIEQKDTVLSRVDGARESVARDVRKASQDVCVEAKAQSLASETCTQSTTIEH